MPAYGPALFISRKDGKPVPEPEQDALLAAVSEACDELELCNIDDIEPVAPELFSYDDQENEVGILLFASEMYAEMSDDVLGDYAEADKEQALQVAKLVEAKFPEVYRFESIHVQAAE